MTPYRWSLLITFLVVWVWAAIHPVYPYDWFLENILVFISVPLILLAARYFKLSDISYTLITLFLIMHVVGSHFTYAEVPLGFTLQEWLGATRNMYDRLVHFSFGLLLAYPMREVFMRVGGAKGFWSYWWPLDITLAFSGLFEIFEWLAAEIVSPEAGLAFLGAQGDIWDAQKDMGLAGLGALLAMLIVAVINARYEPFFWHDLRESFRITKNDKPLGEVKLRDYLKP
ncbi:MAG: hypothetical protein A2542_03855 [Parcubacteria group bacterium RIFOXYD2_FULL_52_8]|nr:MAG: hypothetical protein A2542_03855 [Parcubacteria group bacterium RIFOXYD2_FULL_52_8]